MANPYMPLYTGDYLRKTRRLTDRQHGAYLLILMALWDEGGTLPFDMDELKAIARAPAKARNWEEAVWDKIAPFFIIANGTISHARVTETLVEVHDKRKSYAERGRKGGAANRKKSKHNSGGNQAGLKQGSSNQTKGLVSSLREEKPNLAIDEMEHVAASPPSPEWGGGDAPDTEHVQNLRRWLQRRLTGLMTAHVLSARDVRDLKDALRGGSEDRLLLCPDYRLPPHVAEALVSIAIDHAAMPKLKAIQGGKS